jgi:flagellin
MSVINTNVKSLVAQNALTVNNRAMSKTMEQLSTGKRINTAADDAAGLAISNKMTSQIRGLNQAVRNANDAISMIQTAEGGTIEINNMLQRMRELAVQASNDTNSADDRKFLDLEFSELSAEIDRLAKMTQFNKMDLMTGKMPTGTGTGTTTFHVGANTTQNITVKFKDLSTAGTGSILKTVKVSTGTGSTAFNIASQKIADKAIATIDAAIKNVDEYRAELGSKINRLTYTIDNLSNVSQNTSASRSRVLDTDYAQATTELARTQIVQQAATAMLAQANQQPQSVLSLLQ